MSLDHAQLRAVFVLIAHLPKGASTMHVATMLRLPLPLVEQGILKLAARGMLVNAGKPWLYKTATLITGFDTGQAGAFFDEVMKEAR